MSANSSSTSVRNCSPLVAGAFMENFIQFSNYSQPVPDSQPSRRWNCARRWQNWFLRLFFLRHEPSVTRDSRPDFRNEQDGENGHRAAKNHRADRPDVRSKTSAAEIFS